jgi:SAM-dependent methyltransferase
MPTQMSSNRVVRPYSEIALVYDDSVGIPFFRRTRAAFEAMVQRYGIRFSSAADLGCGTGLFAYYLNRCWGVPVYAVDNSTEMLQQAKRNCPTPGVFFLNQDIRCLRLPNAVDLVVSNFDTLNHLIGLTDLRATFKRVADNLRRAGHFYFDIVTPCKPLGGRDSFVRIHSRPGRCFEQHVRWEANKRLMRFKILHRNVGCCLAMVEHFTERAYSPGEVGGWLLDAGFVIRGLHDEATLRVPVECPPRIIVIAQKSEA